MNRLPPLLMAACVLASLGVNAVVVDPRDGTTRESRALGIQARTMEVYDQIGVVDEVLDRAWVARALAVGFERRRLGGLPLDAMGRGVTPYPAIHVLKQSENERIVHDRLQRLGGRVRWRHRLVALKDESGTGEGPGGVLATVQGDAGVLRISARWCVGADGASSEVRRLRGIDYEGSTNERSYYVADAVGVEGLVEESINERLARQDFLLTFPMGHSMRAGRRVSHHRLLGAVRGEGDTADDAPGTSSAGVAAEGIRAMLERVYGVTYDSLDSFATYRVHHRVAARYRDGAVFLAGDAAHVHSPVGAQGMNTGLQDAHKLADAASGVASDTSLDRYEAERRPVAQHLVRTTDRIFAIVTSNRPLARFVRRRVVPAVLPIVARTATDRSMSRSPRHCAIGCVSRCTPSTPHRSAG